MHLLTLFTFAAVLATRAWGWGDEGHKITATIAQIHLLPSAHRAICSILPSRYGCNLANIATWPDDVKKQREWLWSAGLHFVNGVDDYPPEDCAFGTKGWTTDQNILNAIVNMTRNVGSLTGDDQDVALRFLTHFLGDIHQPLHMTGRDVGGNYVPVLFNGKNTSLHYAWDDLLILERISLLNNYTNPLPTSPDPTVPPPVLARNRHIESALNGSNYDPLIRWIVLEGIYGWWATELEEWTTCPQFAMENQVSQQVMGLTEEPPYKDPIDVPICPYHWAKPSHQMLCDFIWRPDLQGVKHPRDAVYKIELNTPEYAGRVRNEKMVEKQLALGGMRLAAVLNEVLGSEEDIQEFGFFNPNHRHDDPWEQEHDRIREEIRQSHRFQSFADIRENNTVKWHIDGHDYFWALSEILDSAKECIFILDWWLSPEMYLRRPPADNQEWRLDRLLHRKAQQGVKIYVIVYKEVTQTMTLSSRHTKNALNELHENVMCLRHPDHIGSDSAVQFWSHHEKVVIVDNKRACIGGLDACFGRWDTHNHPLADCHPTDFSRTLFPGQDYNNARVLDFQKVDHYVNTQISSLEIGRMPWHDVHMTLTGPVVLDIVQHFIERWNEIKLRKYKKRTQVDWLALPHDVEAEPEHPISRHPHLERWRDIGRKFKQYWQGEGTPPDDVDGHSPFGTCRVQVVRSVGDWSHGVLTEDSVQQAYIQLIREARHFIYIENQFFISNTGNVGPVKNQIAKALVERIVEAASHGQKFKVIVVIPEVPGFAGNIKNENGLKTIMAAQYRTINRGGHSIYEEIRRAGYEPRDYIRFYHLRTYDRINSPASFIKEMEQNSGVTYHEAQIAQARLWIGDDGYWHQEKVQIQGPQTDFGIDLSETATTGKDAQKVVEEVDFPPSSEEAREIVKKFESGATREDLGVADSVGQHVLADRTDLKGEKWYGTEQEERDSYVSEVLYVHSKVMIIDDRRVIMGSANINDRSQKGDGDSEIALVVEDLDEIESTMDGQRFMATRFASTLRRKLFREHLGLIPPQNCDRGETEVTSFMRPAPIPNESEIGTREDDAVSDPLSDQFQDLWISTAKKNRAIFSELFRTVPTNVVHNWAEYKTYFPKVKTGRLATELDLDTIKTKLSQIHGHLVEAPLEFLIQQPELVEGADWQGLNPTCSGLVNMGEVGAVSSDRVLEELSGSQTSRMQILHYSTPTPASSHY